MKVAIFHGFPTIHFEMLGYMYDYCLKRGLDFDVFAHTNLEWKAYYDASFGVQKAWCAPSEFHACFSAYDKIVLLTDDDPFFPKSCFQQCGSKIISIEHCASVRNGAVDAVAARVRTHPCGANLWAIPCYCGEQSEPLKENGLHVAIVGVSTVVSHVGVLRDLFPANFEKVTFHIVNYRVPPHLQRMAAEHPNVRVYGGMPAGDMVAMLRGCSYLLNTLGSRDYYTSVMTGSIPLAYTTGCRLILPREAIGHMALTTPLALEEVAGMELLPLSAKERAAVQEECRRLNAHRDGVFDSVLLG